VTPESDNAANEDPAASVMEIESEQEWLTSLYGFITQGESRFIILINFIPIVPIIIMIKSLNNLSLYY